MDRPRTAYVFLTFYLLFIVYGSLFPLEWALPHQGLLSLWHDNLEKHVSKSDLLTNLVAYIPLGFLSCAAMSRKASILVRMTVAILAGMIVSLFMEYLQIYLPARTSSPIDLGLNILSTGFGAAIYVVWGNRESAFGEQLYRWRQNNIIDGKLSTVGIGVVILWGAVQIAPFAPSLDIGDIRNGLKQLWNTIQNPLSVSLYRIVVYTFNIAALGIVLRLVLRLRRRAATLLAVGGSFVLFLKIFIVGRQLSLEALIGLCAGVAITWLLTDKSVALAYMFGSIFIVTAFVVDELRLGSSIPEYPTTFNWIPFRSQMMENVSGIESILSGLWPFCVLGFFAAYHAKLSVKKIPILFLSITIAANVLVLEYAQKFIVGRFPDITTVLLAVGGWLAVVMLFRSERYNFPGTM